MFGNCRSSIGLAAAPLPVAGGRLSLANGGSHRAGLALSDYAMNIRECGLLPVTVLVSAATSKGLPE